MWALNDFQPDAEQSSQLEAPFPSMGKLLPLHRTRINEQEVQHVSVINWDTGSKVQPNQQTEDCIQML